MKTLFTLLFLITNFVSYGQNKYTDWFDLGLKENPKIVKEIEIFSLSDFLESNMALYYNSSLKSNVFVNEYYFDTRGLISKLYQKDIIDTVGHWLDFSIAHIEHYKDSIIIKREAGWWKEKRDLDKNEYLKSKIISSSGYDTIIYLRDGHNWIINEYRHFFSVDFGRITKTAYERNDKGDIIAEKRSAESYGVLFKEPYIEDNILHYQYVYDAKNNWIVRICIIDNEVSSITQRNIQYE
jgi:hypothetical protein